MKPVILIDVDDTILSNITIMKEYIKEATNGEGCHIKWFDYNFRQFDEEARAYIFEQFESDRMYAYSDAYPFAKHSINILREYCTILFVTASNVKHAELRLEQLKKVFDWVTHEDIIHTKHKNLIKGDIIIDDNTTNVISSICDLKVLITQEWNKEIDVNKFDNVVRAYSWEYIADYCIRYLEKTGKFDFELNRLKGLLN